MIQSWTARGGLKWLHAYEDDLLGIGLSEDTAIIVTGDTFEVMGKWMVAVHDNTRAYQPWEKPYFVLAPGDVYDMKARRITVPVP